MNRAGLDIKLDRWNLGAGQRLWEQIDAFISDPGLSDAWLFYATQLSLGSEACREEYAYALDRALRQRGSAFPIVALFPSPVDETLIPAGIRTRLFVSTTDPDWKERVKAAAEGRAPGIHRAAMDPCEVVVREGSGQYRFAVEVRPRAGSWVPFMAAIPLAEKETVKPSLYHAPRGRVPTGGVMWNRRSGESQDGQWWLMVAGNEATPTQSYYVMCHELPSSLLFGVDGGQPQYTWEFSL